MATQEEKRIKFKIHRFNPQQQKRYVSTYDVPIRKGTTLLDALMYIKDNLDETLAFRHSCRMGICGSCAIMVNGEPMLACYTQVLHLNADTLTIEPLQKMQVIKDLIVDIQPFLETYQRIRPILLKPEDKLAEPNEFLQKPLDLKKFWDLTLCIKCSICYSACPAALDKRFLGPSTLATNYRFIQDSRDEASEERLKPMADNLWLCTSCNSCTTFCPKEVDPSSSIVDERSLFVETGVIPRTTMDILTNTMKYHNPMGINQMKRMDWANDLQIQSFPTVSQADTLYFVGCLAAYEPRIQEIARAMVEVFKLMGTDFATLGTEEWCCGDHILRLGEKGLFEELAEHNASLLQKFNAERIVTISPHCFNTFKNDEPYATQNLNVQHYTQFLADAIKKGALNLSKELNGKVTYHDPCFLGKRNEIYDEPRTILKSIKGLELVEMKRTMRNSFCCGGGAGRVWTEDSPKEGRPAVNRAIEALELGAEIIVTACPFCVSTLEDALKVLDVEHWVPKIEVKDIVELVRETM